VRNVEIDPDEDVAVRTRASVDMVRIPGGTFRMGSDRHYADEAPAHRARVDAFWIDTVPVTNREFRKFVRATGYVTFAEIVPDPRDYPGALPHMLRAGSLVFHPPKHAVGTDNWSQWWSGQTLTKLAMEDLELNLLSREIRRNGQKIELHSRECKRTVSIVALPGLTGRPPCSSASRRASSNASRQPGQPGCPNRRAVQRQQTPSVATDGVCSKLMRSWLRR
jgi:hypothetical protein